MIRDQHIVCSTEILMSMIRRKITACGYDISFENMADLKCGIEGELKDLIQVVLDSMIEGSVPAQRTPDDPDHPDCRTDRECELYDALMGLASHATAYHDDYKQWTQGGVTLEPIVSKALRLGAYAVTSTVRGDT